MSPLTPRQRAFFDLAIEHHVLRFGEFTLKSGRISPYFFNAGLFNTGKSLTQLGELYAEAIIDAGVRFDMLFGPAYKGIPLVSAIASALYRSHGHDYPWAFNRKEAKDHGEGGVIVGAPLQGRVLIVDDLITAGTAIRESASLIQHAGAEIGGIGLALDRQERGQGQLSAVQEVEQSLQTQVVTVANFEGLLSYTQDQFDQSVVNAMQAYRQQYGSTT